MKDLPEDKKSFDIHGGGIDLQFPHHENEIAQSACAHPQGDFARVWMHNEMLMVEGRKMSKSLGNFFTVRDLLDRGVPGEVIRFVFLQTHYSKPMDWTEEKAKQAQNKLSQWFRATDGVTAAPTVPSQFEAALADDLNTHLALTHMERMSAPSLKAAMSLLGFPDAESVAWFRREVSERFGVSMVGTGNLSRAMDLLGPVLLRWQALRDAKDYKSADRIRDALKAMGIEVRSTSGAPQADIAAGAALDRAKLEAFK